MRAFISYSHKDKDALTRLHVHLKALKREGALTTWYDREIHAGSDLDKEIQKQLESVELFMLLISPDFIASDYCVEQEMARALERHDLGNARVVPIIVEPCDWASLKELRKLKAVPEDGKPVSEWKNENNAYLDIIQELRKIIGSNSESGGELGRPNQAASISEQELTNKYRVQKKFDEIDKREFRETSFAMMKQYFENAIAEIDRVEGIRARFSDGGQNSFGGIVVNQARQNETAHITVHLASSNGFHGDISFSFSENAAAGSANGWFSVSCDEYEQYLTGQLGMMSTQHDRLSPDHAAKALWSQFIGQAGITYA